MSVPIEGVLFDFNFTLVHQGEPLDWLELARQRAGRSGPAADEFGDELGAVLDFLDQLWTHARVLDPDSRRDAGPEQHREIFELTLAGLPAVDPVLRAALYETLLEQLGVPAGRALMVGDSWQDDAGAAALGVRTLILPRTEGPVHGLAAVLRLVGLAATG